MLDTKLISVFLVDEFQSAVITVPLWIAAYFECDALVVFEVVAILEYVTDAERKCADPLVSIQCVEVVADEAVRLVAIASISPVAWWRGFLRQ